MNFSGSWIRPQGIGLSKPKAKEAFVTVSNLFFKRSFKLLESDGETFDVDTLPHDRNDRRSTQLEEVKRMNLIASEMEKASKNGKMLTLANDSTTRKGVNKFTCAGVHLGRDNVLPLPCIPTTSETISEMVELTAMPIEMLAASSNKEASNLYSKINCHMTDSVSHNKHLAKGLAVKYERDEDAGQVFCNVHSALGFQRGMNKTLSMWEEKVGIENLFKNVLGMVCKLADRRL